MTGPNAVPIDLSVDVPPAELLGRVHFVGIGGAGMSGIARVLLARGLPVSGSDAKDSRILTALRAEGATVTVGHTRPTSRAPRRSSCPARCAPVTRRSSRRGPPACA